MMGNIRTLAPTVPFFLKVDLALSPSEIAPMLEQCAEERKVIIDIPFFTETLFYFTSGYPFLVSLLCKIIDEKILPGKKQKEWISEDLDKAVQIALVHDNSNFDSLIKNLENNPEFYELVFDIIMNEKAYSFNRDNPMIHEGSLLGILGEKNGKAKIHNRLYEQRIYNYMASKMETSRQVKFDHVSSSYIEVVRVSGSPKSNQGLPADFRLTERDRQAG